MDAASAITAVLQGAGFLGVAILALGIVCIKLYNAYKDVQDKRVADAQEYAKSLNQATLLIQTNTEVIHKLADMWARQNGGDSDSGRSGRSGKGGL